MAAYAFNPTLWSKIFMSGLKKDLVAEAITNKNFYGTPVPGAALQLWNPGTVSVGTYTKSTDVTNPLLETPTDTEDTLNIDQNKYFSFYVDDLDKAQGGIDPEGPYTDEARYALSDTIDQAVLAQYPNAHANNIVYPASALAYSNVRDDIAKLYTKLTVSKVPRLGRFLVISPAVEEAINAYLASKNTALTDQANANGYKGMFCGFEIYVSHNVPHTTNTAGTSGSAGSKHVDHCLAGHRSAIAMAYSIPAGSLETFRPEKRFGTGVKGLCCYGLKTIQSGVRLGVYKPWTDA